MSDSSEMSIEPICLSHIKSNTILATTPAEFNLTVRGQHTPVKPRYPHIRNSVDQPMSRREDLIELNRLRSSAFWELRQNITENGEGFVHRMRDYEGSRSRHDIHLRIKEAEKRGRKRLSLKKNTTIIHTSEDDDEEEIHICSGESSRSIPKFLFRAGRAQSLDAIDLDVRRHDSLSTWQMSMRSCPSCEPQCSSGRQLDFFAQKQDTEPRFPSSILSSPSSLCSLYETTKQSPTSPSCEPISFTTDDLPLPLLSSTSYHKVITALNLALANGAGSVEDYSSVREYQSRFQAECYDHGDLWH